ncbi:methionine ABC transporter ATP-binding protein [Paenibacillus crassostreae]|uniref:Methionine ABC transporter ATP-binding protein n=1 Tax=Paenibacillus crassostreae TaxID=1763538 RepID=A0A167GQS8_9BACL|nr:methionine ABC transporter ATP-binding protein [Paenibacillus crassostreae]AOZ92009.1 methionine ABC transporter ATP-binding protein [Paenibacillus crassostreae]OAB77816.1 methionine ABC transporter ATP-binding protein [Paenibacillus crassostreae]
MIELKNLTKEYSAGNRITTALSGLNLSVDKGEIFGVIGHSGAGKSTLIRCINLLERPNSGEVWVNGVNLTSLRTKQLQAERRKIGMIYQHFNLLSSATVYENIAFPLRLAHISNQEIEIKVNDLLALVGLEEHHDKYPAQLSGGQKQRVGIARALASDPEVLLCDEATSALDPQTTDSILKLLLDINKRFHLTIVLITHEMHVIQSICDRVGVIHQGGIVEQGTVSEVFLKPRHPITRDFTRGELDHSDLLMQAINMKSELPFSSQVVKITFLGGKTYESILSRTVRETGVDFAILQGTISTLKDTPYGQLIVRFEGESEYISTTIHKLVSQGLEVEVLD